jgi:hypothetical protein
MAQTEDITLKKNKKVDYDIRVTNMLLSVVKNNEMGHFKHDTKKNSIILSACRIAKDAADKKKSHFWNISIELSGLGQESISELEKWKGKQIYVSGNLKFWSHSGKPYWRVVATEVKSHEMVQLFTIEEETK